MKTGDKRTLLVASPDCEFINYLYGRLTQMKKNDKQVCIGEMQFSIESIKTLNPYIDSSTKLITGTPLVLRIPQKRYAEYGIKSNKPYAYWRPENDISAFVNQLTDNLAKKYKQYYNREIDDKNVFTDFTFKKDVCVHRVENGKEVQTIGTIWEFGCDYLTVEQRKMVWLGLESGFGELNASGFGFMNVIKK
jgi:CRISPR-associated endoribonuclease Cas6